MEDLMPFEIEILLHYYSSPATFRNTHCQAFKDAIVKFREAGMLMENIDTGNYIMFKKEPLELYVNEIKKVKLPVQIWAIPNEL